MDLKFLIILLGYWGFWILITTIGVSDGSNPLYSENFTLTSESQLNSTGFSSTEIDTGGFFTTLSGIAVAMGRFFAFALFGFTPALTGLSQILVSMWASCWTLLTIAWLIAVFWDG